MSYFIDTKNVYEWSSSLFLFLILFIFVCVLVSFHSLVLVFWTRFCEHFYSHFQSIEFDFSLYRWMKYKGKKITRVLATMTVVAEATANDNQLKIASDT